MSRNAAKGSMKPIFKMSKDEFVGIDSNRKVKDLLQVKESNKITGLIRINSHPKYFLIQIIS